MQSSILPTRRRCPTKVTPLESRHSRRRVRTRAAPGSHIEVPIPGRLLIAQRATPRLTGRTTAGTRRSMRRGRTAIDDRIRDWLWSRRLREYMRTSAADPLPGRALSLRSQANTKPAIRRPDIRIARSRYREVPAACLAGAAHARQLDRHTPRLADRVRRRARTWHVPGLSLPAEPRNRPDGIRYRRHQPHAVPVVDGTAMQSGSASSSRPCAPTAILVFARMICRPVRPPPYSAGATWTSRWSRCTPFSSSLVA